MVRSHRQKLNLQSIVKIDFKFMQKTRNKFLSLVGRPKGTPPGNRFSYTHP